MIVLLHNILLFDFTLIFKIKCVIDVNNGRSFNDSLNVTDSLYLNKPVMDIFKTNQIFLKRKLNKFELK